MEVVKNQKIGEGACAKVYRGTTSTGGLVAVKCVQTDTEHAAEAAKEYALLRKLVHPNIVRVIGYHYTRESHTADIIMEYAAGGTLAALLLRAPKLEFSTVAMWARQMTDGLAYLHSKNIVHRDIKPSNLLLVETSQVPAPTSHRHHPTTSAASPSPSAPTMSIKIADFGFSQLLAGNKAGRAGVVGTLPYMPAPALKGEVRFTNDIYAVACTLLEVVTRHRPWEGMDSGAVRERVLAGQTPFEQLGSGGSLQKGIAGKRAEYSTEETSALHAFIEESLSAGTLGEVQLATRHTIVPANEALKTLCQRHANLLQNFGANPAPMSGSNKGSSTRDAGPVGVNPTRANGSTSSVPSPAPVRFEKSEKSDNDSRGNVFITDGRGWVAPEERTEDMERVSLDGYEVEDDCASSSSSSEEEDFFKTPTKLPAAPLLKAKRVLCKAFTNNSLSYNEVERLYAILLTEVKESSPKHVKLCSVLLERLCDVVEILKYLASRDGLSGGGSTDMPHCASSTTQSHCSSSTLSNVKLALEDYTGILRHFASDFNMLSELAQLNNARTFSLGYGPAETERLLRAEGRGSYIIRPSSRQMGTLVLSSFIQNNQRKGKLVGHFILVREEDGLLALRGMEQAFPSQPQIRATTLKTLLSSLKANIPHDFRQGRGSKVEIMSHASSGSQIYFGHAS